MFRIGEFSKLVRVSPRMLRHYEKCGLVQPAEIDEATGYRQYSATQIPHLSRIVALRDMGFPIDEIADLLPHFEDTSLMVKALNARKAEVKSTIEAEQEKLARIMHMSESMCKEHNIMLYDVELKDINAVKVITLRGTIPKYNQEGLLWERLGRFIDENQVACSSGGYSVYLDDEYKEENPTVEVAIPVEELGSGQGDFVFKEYPAIKQAATLRFSGQFDGGYDMANEKLAAWMEENGYEFAGNLRGHVIVDPEEEPSPENWLTELQAPVRKAM